MNRENFSAYPLPGYKNDETVDGRQEGMSMLEHYAGQLMVAHRILGGHGVTPSVVAERAMQDAKALLKALDKS